MGWSDKKQAIFYEAVRQFSERGYSAVSTRELAAALDINSSTIYCQFKNKEDILNEIFNVFEQKMKRYLLTKEQVDVYIEIDSPRRLLERCLQDFMPDENEFMIRAYRIACMEMMQNSRAKDLVTGRLLGETEKSIQYVLDKLVEHGKISAIETRLFARFWAQFMFSETVTWISGLSKGDKVQITSHKSQEIGEFLINMVITGKFPRTAVK